MKLASQMTFEHRIYFCLENLTYFAQSGNEIHDSSHCMLKPCSVKCFCYEIFSYVKRRRSLHLGSSSFLSPYAKYPIAFYDIFLAIRHKNFFLEFFKEE